MDIGSKFALRAALLSVALFGVLRLPWIEASVVLPFTNGQASVAAVVFGSAPLVAATLACSGTDAIALCLGVIFAYPVRWRDRWIGAAGGTVLILLLNTIRIGTLGQAAAELELFNALHVYIWPALLTVSIAVYVFAWMRGAGHVSPGPMVRSRPFPSQRFIGLSIAFLLLFVATAPVFLESARLLALAGVMAEAAAVLLRAIGVNAHAAANTLWTSNGGFVVTQECIATPLIPVYLAAVVATAASWRWMVLGIAAAAPLFIGLGIIRLLVVVLPAASPTFFVHAFYQLLTGIVVVIAAAVWRYRNRTAMPHAAVGVVVGAFCLVALDPWTTQLIAYPLGAPLNDPQGAIAWLPAFQIGLYVALWVAACRTDGWKRFAAGLLALALSQAAVLLVLHIVSTYVSATSYVREVRAWAIAGPVLFVAMATTLGRTPDSLRESR